MMVGYERRMEVRQDLTRYETVKLIQEWMATRKPKTRTSSARWSMTSSPDDPCWLLDPPTDLGPGLLDRVGCSHAVC